MRKYNVYERFDLKVTGFSDSLPLFKKKIPGLTKYSQSFLVEKLLGETYDAHNAKEDVKVLYKLVNLNAKTEDMKMYSFTVSHVKHCLEEYDLVKTNIVTFNCLIRDKILSKQLCKKAAASGLKLEHLKTSFERNGYDGLYSVLSEPVQGRPRVTKTKKIVEKIAQYFSK